MQLLHIALTIHMRLHLSQIVPQTILFTKKRQEQQKVLGNTPPLSVLQMKSCIKQY